MKAVSITNYPAVSRASEEIIRESRNLKGELKKGRVGALTNYIDGATQTFIASHIPGNAVLVPVPRSAPLIADAVWPALEIARHLRSLGLGMSIEPMLSRISPVAPGHLTHSAADRATVVQHYNSLQVTPILLPPQHIFLIDDVLTAGRTAAACRLRLRQLYPEIPIEIFTVMTTKSFNNVNSLVEHQVNSVNYNPATGNTYVS